jgi:hypothetical protein
LNPRTRVKTAAEELRALWRPRAWRSETIPLPKCRMIRHNSCLVFRFAMFVFTVAAGRTARCIVLVLIGLLIVHFRAAAELEAKTSDGRVVVLSNDGTWKFQSSSASPDAANATLEIEAGLVFESGPRPVAREKFYLLDVSLNELVKRYKDATAKHKPLTIQTFAVCLTWIGAGDIDGHGAQERSLANAVLRDVRGHVLKEVTTDFGGRARFEGLPVGNYFIFGATVRVGRGAVVWNLPVQLKPGANSTILDQHNASGID